MENQLTVDELKFLRGCWKTESVRRYGLIREDAHLLKKLNKMIDSLLSEAGKKEPEWLDRPDKTGWYWVRLMPLNSNEYDTFIQQINNPRHFEEGIAYEGKLYKAKWLYIEEPTPPEGR